MFAIDVDGDGDIDAVSACNSDSTVMFHENLDGSGGSWSDHDIFTTAAGVYDVIAIDLDSDSDVGALSANYGDENVVWCVTCRVGMPWARVPSALKRP